MTDPTTRASGQLSVRLKSNSMFLTHSLPIEVRDSNMRLVKRARSHQFDLPVGLYEVSAILEDGCKHSALVQVKAGEQTPVELGPDEESEPPRSIVQTEPSIESFYQPGYRWKMVALTEAEPTADSAIAVELLDVNRATLLENSRNPWIFECKAAIDEVPSALFRIGGRRQEISLPMNADGGFPSNFCAVRIEKTPGARARVQAWISPERTVANALQNMLVTGHILEAAAVADDAVELLRDKYNDPTGAALGALILYKTGRLKRLTGWVENLARDFDWLPDGAVILASLLYDDGGDMDRVLDLAIQASQRRMLYTESYSLLLDLLRRCPQDIQPAAKREALSMMASRASYIDWETICMSHGFPDGDE